VITPGYFPGHSSAGRSRLGSSKEAIGVLPGSDCSLSAHLEPVVLDHGDPHGPRGARSGLLPALTSVGRCPKGPESGVLRRLVAWPGWVLVRRSTSDVSTTPPADGRLAPAGHPFHGVPGELEPARRSGRITSTSSSPLVSGPLADFAQVPPERGDQPPRRLSPSRSNARRAPESARSLSSRAGAAIVRTPMTRNPPLRAPLTPPRGPHSPSAGVSRQLPLIHHIVAGPARPASSLTVGNYHAGCASDTSHIWCLCVLF
jgi:hypothetical protein